MSDKSSDSSAGKPTQRPDLTTAVATTLAIITMMGMLWTGTSLNQGYEAPQVLVIPTVWAAAAIAALALTTAFACLTYLRSSRTPHSESPSPDTDTAPTEGPSDPSKDGVSRTDIEDGTHRGRRVQGPSIKVGDSNRSGGRGSDEQTKQRAKENFPDRMSEEGNEDRGQFSHPSKEAVPTPSRDTDTSNVGSEEDPQSGRDNSTKSSEQVACEPSPRSDRRGELPGMSHDDHDRGSRPDSDEGLDHQMPKSYYRSCRNRIVRSEFRR